MVRIDDQARRALGEHLEDYLKGVNKDVATHKIPVCPCCKSGSHKDSAVKIYGKTETKDGVQRWYCHSCGTGGDLLDFIRYDKKISISEAFEWACKEYNYTPVSDGVNFPRTSSRQSKTENNRVRSQAGRADQSAAAAEEDPKQANIQPPEADYTSYFLQVNQNIENTDYHRGISLRTLNRFKVGYDPSWKHPDIDPEKAKYIPDSPRLIIPTSQSSYIARDTRKPEDIPDNQKDYVKSKVGKVHIFNADALKTAQRRIFVVEGEIDALSIIDVGGEAIAIGGAHMWKKTLIEAIKEEPPAQPLVLALDNDKTERQVGQRANKDLAEALKQLNIAFCVFDKYGVYKDANEMLTADRDALRQAVEEAESMALEENTIVEVAAAEDPKQEELTEEQKEARDQYIAANLTANHIGYFTDLISGMIKTTYYPTGFTALDNTLDGGLYGRLYIIGARSSLGKTTFILQIADYIAEHGQDVLIFSLEMEREELMAKSISRLTYKLDPYHASSTMEVLRAGEKVKEGAKLDKIAEALEIYEKKHSKHVYIIEGGNYMSTDEIKEKVAQHKSYTGKAPVVFVDYLQILNATIGMERATDKQILDQSVRALKLISRDYKTPVVVVSSFNRNSYNKEAAMEAFSGSSGIEYSSDILISLETETDKEKTDEDRAAKRKEEQNSNKRMVTARILKNRNGYTGDIGYEFNLKYNYFTECSQSSNGSSDDPF